MFIVHAHPTCGMQAIILNKDYQITVALRITIKDKEWVSGILGHI